MEVKAGVRNRKITTREEAARREVVAMVVAVMARKTVEVEVEVEVEIGTTRRRDKVERHLPRERVEFVR